MAKASDTQTSQQYLSHCMWVYDFGEWTTQYTVDMANKGINYGAEQLSMTLLTYY